MMSESHLLPKPSPRPLSWAAIVPQLQHVLDGYDDPVYLVGGVVRDAFWGLAAHDVDLAVHKGGFRVARKIANALNGAFYKLDPERETGRAIVESDGRQWVVDVANFRGDSLLADLTGRDFTLNAVAAPLKGDLAAVIDPLDGLADAQRRILRRCSPQSLADDPIRALRAVRLSTRFKLRIEPATLADIKREGPRLIDTSPERARDEFMALLGGPRPAAGLRALDTLGLLKLLLPEVEPMRGVTQSAPHQFDVWQHTLMAVEQLGKVLATIGPTRSDNTAAQAGLGMIVYFLDRFRPHFQEHLAQIWPQDRSHAALLMLAALLHDCGKPDTRQVEDDRIRFFDHERLGATLAEKRGRGLVLSNHETARLTQIVRHHMRPLLLNQEKKVSRKAIYRFWRDCGEAGLDVCLLSLADYLATVGATLSPDEWTHFLQTIEALLDGYYHQEEKVVDLPALVTGNDLMENFDLSPGPQIGELLERIREAQATGEVQTAEAALALAREYLQ